MVCGGVQMPAHSPQVRSICERIGNGIKSTSIFSKALKPCTQANMQSVNFGKLIEPGEISSDVFRAGATYHVAQTKYFACLCWLCVQVCINLAALESGGIDVLARVLCLDRNKGQSFIFQRCRYRAFGQIKKIQQILRSDRFAILVMEFDEREFCIVCLFVTLILIQLMNNGACSSQFVHSA